MKDTFDLNSLDGDYAQEIATGIFKDSAKESVAGRLFGAGTEVRSTTGKLPYLNSKSSMVQDTKHGASRVAIGAKPNEIYAAHGSKAYDFEHKFALKGSILKAEVLNMASIVSPATLLEYIHRMSINKISVDIDKDLFNLLSDTSENVEIAAPSPWSDNALARPITDIEAMHDTGAGEYDLVVIGQDKMRALTKLDTFKTRSQNYTGTGSIEDSRATMKEVLDFLFADLAGIQNVIIGNTWYDKAGSSSPISTGRVFDGLMWMGNSDHVQMLKIPSLDEGDQYYDKETQRYIAYWNVHAKMVRTEKQMGATLTGV